MIYGFMHVYQVNHWETIVCEQIEKIMDSSLSVWMEKLFIGINGNQHMPTKLDYNQVEFLYRVNHPQLYEAMTLSFLRMFCKGLNDNDIVFYIHTKGVSRKEEQKYTDWRHLMEHFIIERYQECWDEIEIGNADIVGVNWHLGEGYQGATASKCGGTPVTPHFSGNFWWASAGYIKHLPPLYPMISKYDCEFWHAKNEPVACELWNSGVMHHRKEYPEHLYKGKLNVKYQ